MSEPYKSRRPRVVEEPEPKITEELVATPEPEPPVPQPEERQPEPDPEPPPVQQSAPAQAPPRRVSLVYKGRADLVDSGPFFFRPGVPVEVPSDVAEELLTLPFEPFEVVAEE